MVVLDALTIQIVLYVLISISFLMIVARLYISWMNDKTWGVEDAWMFATLFFLAGVGYAAHAIKYDTNNVLHPERLTAEQIRRRVIGSQMVLIGRFCYASR